jgi:uncharacterized membrane protein YccC
MGTAAPSFPERDAQRSLWRRVEPLLRGISSAGPPLLFGLRLWVSVCVALYVAFWLELDNAYWAGTTAAIVCQPQVGASLRKGWYRLIGTVVGAVMIVVLTACFPQDRSLFLISLALWGGVCAFTATILHNFAAYSAALAGYTAAIIAGDQLGATGGLNGDAFMLGITRVSEIGLGIVCAGIVLAGTDLGGAPRRLATLLAGLGAAMTAKFVGTLASAGPNLPDMQPVRREFIRQVVALDPVIDATLGESSRIRYHTPVLQIAVDGLFAALAGWRGVANHLVRLGSDQVQANAAAVLRCLPPELRSRREQGDPTLWTANPTGLHRICEATVRRLLALPADTPSLRLLADQAAEMLAGMSQALNGLALLVHNRAPRVQDRDSARPSVPDWLPALVNGGRAVVMIGAAALFWIVTVWPSGATAITFTAIGVILFAPQADRGYAVAIQFAMGTVLGAAGAAILNFAVLPALHGGTFGALAFVLGVYLVPVGALATQPWKPAMFTAMTVNFVPLLAPANVMNYDPPQLYNAALAIIGGIGAAALSLRLLPPLTPGFRTRRLLQLTLRDLRRLARRRMVRGWEPHIFARLAALPDQATPLQRAQLLAALSVGTEIVRLRHSMARLGFEAQLDPALSASAEGDSRMAIAHLARIDALLVAHAGTETDTQTVLRARGSIIVLSEALTHHAAYFDGALA